MLSYQKKLLLMAGEIKMLEPPNKETLLVGKTPSQSEAMGISPLSSIQQAQRRVHIGTFFPLARPESSYFYQKRTRKCLEAKLPCKKMRVRGGETEREDY